MIKKSISLILALSMGLIPTEKPKEVSISKNFSLSSPVFRQSADGETEEVKSIGALEKSVNLYGDSENLPEKFDLRESGKLSPVRNQTGFGTCWSHSAIASAETSIIDSKPDINLSEFHTAYYPYSAGDQTEPVADDINQQLNRGGTNYVVTNIWSQWIGPVFEKRLKYGDTDFFSNDSDVENMKYKADYHLRNTYTFDYDKEKTNFDDVNNLAKQFVYSGKAVDVSFYSSKTKFYDDKKFSTNSDKKSKYANHSVVIVGWDDNYSAGNFKLKPENDGAWLVKNSWGESFGDNGYMWISYYDTSLCEFSVFEIEDSDKYKINFHHDSFVSTQSLSAYDDSETNNGSYMANVFYNDNGNVQIEAITTYINNCDTDYEIMVYTDLQDISDPSSGTPSEITKGNSQLTGYFTFDLDKSVFVENNSYFSVVVKLYNKDNPYVVPLETCLCVEDSKTKEITSFGTFTKYEGLKANTGANESFYSTDGENWTDLLGDDYIYTDEEVEELIAQLEEDLFEDVDPDNKSEVENAKAALETYTDILHSGTVSVISGNIALKALANPCGTVHFSHDSGVVSDGTLIELSAESDDIKYYINDEEFAYTEPIEITKTTTITAVCGDCKSERTYIPKSCYTGLGDVNGNGLVDAVDASAVLMIYSRLSTSDYTMSKILEDYADFNQDCFVNASDASGILARYAELSTK